MKNAARARTVVRWLAGAAVALLICPAHAWAQRVFLYSEPTVCSPSFKPYSGITYHAGGGFAITWYILSPAYGPVTYFGQPDPAISEDGTKKWTRPSANVTCYIDWYQLYPTTQRDASYRWHINFYGGQVTSCTVDGGGGGIQPALDIAPSRHTESEPGSSGAQSCSGGGGGGGSGGGTFWCVDLWVPGQGWVELECVFVPDGSPGPEPEPEAQPAPAADAMAETPASITLVLSDTLASDQRFRLVNEPGEAFPTLLLHKNADAALVASALAALIEESASHERSPTRGPRVTSDHLRSGASLLLKHLQRSEPRPIAELGKAPTIKVRIRSRP